MDQYTILVSLFTLKPEHLIAAKSCTEFKGDTCKIEHKPRLEIKASHYKREFNHLAGCE